MNNSKSESKKLIPIYLMELFSYKTDESHYVRMPEILNFLESKGIFAERRTIYSAISILNSADFEIIGVQEKGGYKYHHPTRKFDTNELKFLIDSVAASKFLTEKKSKELINKIKSLGSVYDTEYLNRNILLSKRIKSMNDKVLKNLDILYAAINSNNQITFQYVRWTWQKKLIYLKGGNLFNASPYAISLFDDNYYLIAFDNQTKQLKHYRVDKMQTIKLLAKTRVGKEDFDNFDISEYAAKTFNMYGGKEEYIKLQCKNSLANVIIDRFGKNLIIRPDFDNPDYFIVGITINVSPQFYGWLFGLGADVKVLSPNSVIESYKKTAEKILSVYNAD